MSDPVMSSRSILERFSLKDKTALVTGGGQGIGRAFAYALGEAGASVAVVDLVSERAVNVAEELKAKGIDSIAVQADVTKADDVERIVETIVKLWGKLTIAANNAGIGQWHDAEKLSEAEWNKIMDVNLKGVFLCAQAEAQVMLKAGYGKIINTASMSGSIVNTPQNQMPYNVSKAGVIHMTKSLAAEWSPRGIRVNCISPGYTRTQLVEDLLKTPIGKDMMPRWMSLTPMKRMAEVTDLQGAVVYLASEASDYMTGHDLVIDGGYSVW
ncbi:glucose 1-dehydrogenase [Candidatus Bathyarchaeota archaeon]|nr:glucose 1-dehydrogenase [Candidatus Bathyarchaeota archaeon]